MIIGDGTLYQYNIGSGHMKKVTRGFEGLWYYHSDKNEYQSFLGYDVAFEMLIMLRV